MSLQNQLPNRRQFLERSMLGFGSAFLLPSLLTSCTDHRIPTPDPGSDPNLLGDSFTIDWQDDVRGAVLFGIGKIPLGGEVVSSLVGTLWPASESPFDKMRGQMQQLIDQTLADEKYEYVKGLLGDLEPRSGLVGDLSLYLLAVKSLCDDPNNDKLKLSVVSNFTIVRNSFINRLNAFTEDKFKVVLLPLFAQFANMYLAFLREGALYGKYWNMDQNIINSVSSDLDTYIESFTTHVGDYSTGTYALGVKSALAFANDANKHLDDQAHWHLVEPFATTNAYSRQTTFDVLDFVDTWKYYSVKNYPNGPRRADGGLMNTSEILTREIYSDPRGTTLRQVPVHGPSGNWVADHPPIPLPSPLVGWPKSFPTQISVWAGDRIDAIQVTYPQGGGPAGITQTARMGGPGGNIDVDGGVIYNQLSNPITQFRVGTLNTALNHLPILSFLQFGDSQNKALKLYGGKDTIQKDDWGWVSYAGMAVSSIYVGGGIPVQGHTTANCVVVGFRYWDSPALILRAVRLNYITSPKEKSLTDLANDFPGVTIPASLIDDKAKADRVDHWKRISG